MIMYTLEALQALQKIMTGESNERALSGVVITDPDNLPEDQKTALNTILDTPIADLRLLSNCDTLREFLIHKDDAQFTVSDYFGVVIDDWNRNPYKTVEEAECRICEEFRIAMLDDYTGKSIEELENTDPEDE
jgi:hypothetical protein